MNKYYYCKSCEETIDERECKRSYSRGGAVLTCPECGNADLIDEEKAYQCVHCDEWFSENELWNGYCEDCAHVYEAKVKEAELKKARERGLAQIAKFNNKWRTKFNI